MFTVKHGDTILQIDANGTLVQIIGLGEGGTIEIPHKFDKNIEIKAIGERVCGRYSFSKVIIDDEISLVCEEAFSNAKVEEVVWPAACKVIPYHCFFASAVTKVSNIDNVVEVEDAAFYGSLLQEMRWPSRCKKIPADCFGHSNLTKFENFNHITHIGIGAFAYTHISEHLNFSQCCIDYIGACAFLSIYPGDITLPYYFNKEGLFGREYEDY